MRAARVVVPPPALDHDPRLGEAVEDLAVQELVAELGVEALAVPVLPWAARLDEGGSGAHSRDPLTHRLGDELRTVIGADVPWHAVQDEEVGQNVDDVRGSQLPVDADGEALTSELVDHVQHPELAAVVGAVLHEVVGPDVVRP